MNAGLIYLLLLKASVTSFSGLSSLPVVRSDFVVKRKVITDRQLNTAVAVARMTPGPLGLYLVLVGHQAGGVAGAAAGFAAMITPAFAAIGLLRYAGQRAEQPEVRGVVRAVTLAGAGLLLATAIPFARDAIGTVASAAIAAAAFAALAFTKTDTAWVIAGAAVAGIATRSVL